MKPGNIRLGRAGEEKAASYLSRCGYAILDRNWHFGHLEIDIVCEKEQLIVFVEVKTRRGTGFGGASRAVTAAKQKNLAQAALGWLKEKELWERPCRFDIVCLTGSGENQHLEHFRDAFDIAGFMDCSDSAW